MCSPPFRPALIGIEVEADRIQEVFDSQTYRHSLTPDKHQNVQLEVWNIARNRERNCRAATHPINTTDATIGNTFESRRITELPLNAGNVVGLLSLTTGCYAHGICEWRKIRPERTSHWMVSTSTNNRRGLDVVTNQAFSSVLRVMRELGAGVSCCNNQSRMLIPAAPQAHRFHWSPSRVQTIGTVRCLNTIATQ